MIDAEVEKFTATGAIEAGLIDAIKRDGTSVEGHYKISKDGDLTLRQRNFMFVDKAGNTRCGKFVDNYQLMNFCEEFSKMQGGDEK